MPTINITISGDTPTSVVLDSLTNILTGQPYIPSPPLPQSMTNEGGGVYSYSFTGPNYYYQYTYTITWSDLSTQTLVGVLAASTADGYGSDLQIKSFVGPIYVTIQNSTKQYWNGSAFEDYNSLNWAHYATPMTQQGVGDGYYICNFPADIPSGIYYPTYYHQLGSVAATTDTLLVAGQFNWSGVSLGPVTSYATLATIKSYLGITDNNSDSLLLALTAQASVAMNNSLKRNLTLCAYYDHCDGEGTTYIESFNYPIITITSITDVYMGTTWTGSYFVWNQEGTIRFNNANMGNAGYFAPGYQRYLIASQCGYSTIPQDLQLACCMYVQYLYNYSQVNPLLGSVTAKEVKVQYGKTLMGDFSDGIFQPIEAILSRYRKIAVL